MSSSYYWQIVQDCKEKIESFNKVYNECVKMQKELYSINKDYNSAFLSLRSAYLSGNKTIHEDDLVSAYDELNKLDKALSSMMFSVNSKIIKLKSDYDYAYSNYLDACNREAEEGY